MQLSQDVGHRPMIFIRFNPDEYEEKGTTITSCWGTNRHGVCVVKTSKRKEWNARLAVLREQIEYWSNPVNETGKTVEIVQLFYDK